MATLTDNILLHLSLRVNILYSDVNLLSVLWAGLLGTLQRIGVTIFG